MWNKRFNCSKSCHYLIITSIISMTILVGVSVINPCLKPSDMVITSSPLLPDPKSKDTLLTQEKGYVEKNDSSKGESLREKGVPVIKDLHQTDSQRKRIERVQKVCKNKLNTSITEPNQLPSMYVNDEYKFLYCLIPKVGCTNWMRVLLVLSGKTNITDPLDISPADVHRKYGGMINTLDKYSPGEIQHRLKHYFKFMIVREPLDRLYSAYNNKFVGESPYFITSIGTAIIRKFRSNATQEALKTGKGVTFQEFVKYIIDPETRKKKYNGHWQEFVDVCQPCQINYDFIGKYETLDDDVKLIFEKLHVDHHLKYPSSRRPPKASPTRELSDKAILDLSAETFTGLLDVYRKDYEMFGYGIPKISTIVSRVDP